MVRPQLVGRAVRVVTVEGASPVVIVGEPADEIAEAWHDFSSLAIVWLTLNALVLAVLYVVLGRVLDPLASLSKGMLNLEDGHYATRLAKPKVKELAVITERINTLAGALDTARGEQPPLPPAHHRAGRGAPRDRQRAARRGRALPVRHHGECLVDSESRRSASR
jgi:two-component system sensor histidine kinase UhpB